MCTHVQQLFLTETNKQRNKTLKKKNPACRTFLLLTDSTPFANKSQFYYIKVIFNNCVS